MGGRRLMIGLPLIFRSDIHNVPGIRRDGRRRLTEHR